MVIATVVTGSEATLIDSPNCEVQHVTLANTGDHVLSKKFTKVTQAIVQCNHTAAHYTDEFYSAEVDSTVPSKVIIHIAGSDTAGVPVTVWMFGEP